MEYIDEWIEETYQTRDAERLFRYGKEKWCQKVQEKHQQRWRDHMSSGAPPSGLNIWGEVDEYAWAK